jgi:enoyl-CoA hydratase/carnithine racemase
MRFVILYGANDPVHAGGDLKESLSKLDQTLASKKLLENNGAGAEEVDKLYEWGDSRLEKAFVFYQLMRALAAQLRIIAVCGGGTRYGGSAEIPLMADYLVGDSRSGMCFSESMIGLIPGWSGVGRAVTKAGVLNARFMAETCREMKAAALGKIGIYNVVVEVPFPLPRMEKSGDAEADKARYQEALETHNDLTGARLLPVALDLAVCPGGEIPVVQAAERAMLATENQLAEEINRRSDPLTYEGLWSKPLSDAKEAIKTLGRPLAPQSIAALEGLFAEIGSNGFCEEEFVEAEWKADARLYRDARFRAGIIATLEQKVADFREVKG